MVIALDDGVVGDYIRFQSRYPRAGGGFVGVFGMVNVLGRHGMLTPMEEARRRESNSWYDAAYPDPCQSCPTAYEDPLAAAWFKSTAHRLLERVAGYLAILDAHSIAWERVAADDPGQVTYEDAYQVIAIPRRG